MTEVVRGIVLETKEWGDHHLIATLFSSERGLLKALGRYARAKKSSLAGLLSPFLVVELHLASSAKGFPTVQSGTVLHQFPQLRETLPLLAGSCSLLKAVLDSQLEGKPAPLLYNLLLKYLEALPASPPETLVSSFYLKLLRHEGLLKLEPYCAVCRKEVEGFAIEEGTIKCYDDAIDKDSLLEKEEAQLFLALGLSTSLHYLKPLVVPPLLKEKIEALFRYALQ
jgi:DNA repair protein RecO (recombination protein O)